MNFFDLTAEKRVQLAMLRTKRQLEELFGFVQKEPVVGAGMITGLLIAAVFCPLEVIMIACIAALVLFAVNFFNEPSLIEMAGLAGSAALSH